ncbi:MAG: Gfo/Idh/MocA family oxidoreductase [Gemmatimonadota bacterium]|nr:Gfo/Idh/MocA family oxidoreductase [Gemmatimonadota bacterium]MDH5759378.1 Gfo/Idh/MocA family oxidoreductase [Gemmatimonadota bacterium]
MTEGKGLPRVAVVGAGAISQVVHVPILSEHPGVELVAVSDVDLHKAVTVAQRYAVPLVLGPEEFLDRDDVDAVVICTPNASHEELTLAALEAGKHVFVERPVALSSKGVARVLEKAREAGRILEVSFPHRFRPEVSALRAFVAGGELGDIYAVRASWLKRPMPVMRPAWRQDPAEAGGGVLMDLGVPALDLCLWLIGRPRVTRLRAIMTGDAGMGETAASILAETDQGVAVSLEVSHFFFSDDDRYYARVMGTEGSGSLAPFEVYRQLGGRPLDVTPRQPRPRGGENVYTNAYRRQLDHFVRSVAGSADTPIPEEQQHLMELVEAAYRSARDGVEVAL